MYSDRSGLVLGFHGCVIEVRNKIVSTGGSLKRSTNLYDWLGSGVYFWENSPDRALNFVQELNAANSGKSIESPSVLGAIIDLKHCLDLTEFKKLKLLKSAYDDLSDKLSSRGIPMPQNKTRNGSDDLLLRFLDRAVIENLHEYNEKSNEYDSVKGMFIEGNMPYPNAGFKEKNHVQICIRNPDCIKGYFIPRNKL